MEKNMTIDERSSTLRRGAWSEEEDSRLRRCMEKFGAIKWCDVPSKAGLNRCRKSCRLRWLNYLSPSIKRGRFEDDEEDLIMRLHKLLGNRYRLKVELKEKGKFWWSLIAGRLPGRTANDIKNHWNTHLSKKAITKEKSWNSKTFAKCTPSIDPKEKKEESTIIKPQARTIPVNWSWLNYQPVHQGLLQDMTGINVDPQPPSGNNNGSKEESATVIYRKLDNLFLDINDMTVGEMQTNFEVENIGEHGDEEFFLKEDAAGWAVFLQDMDL